VAARHIYVVLLRAVNVGGRGAVPMARLRGALADHGYDDVKTYLQSGNVVLGSTQSATTVGRDVATFINGEFGLTVGVVVRTGREMAAVVERNPFLPSKDLASLHVVFLPAAPAPSALTKVDAARFVPEEFAAVGREVYLHLPGGMGRSKLATTLTRALPDGTARNWRTVIELHRLSSE
jgi:uncharacterized protein (DUF1697 family)